MKSNCDMPNWVPVEAWAGYVEMRKKIRKPMTDRAVSLAICALKKMLDDGQDVAAVLDQSTLNSWQGLFEVRQERRSVQRQGSISQLGKHGQATANNAQDWLEES